MPDLLDGPVIDGPRIAGRTPPGSTVDLDEPDDTPASRLHIPTETLDQSPQERAVGRKRLRLLMAWELFCSLHAGHVTAITGRADKSRAWCWDQADKFFADHDRPTPTPAAPVTADTIRLSEVDIDTA